MNSEEQKEYEENMGSPEAEYGQYLVENPEANQTAPMSTNLQTCAFCGLNEEDCLCDETFDNGRDFEADN